MSYKVIALLMVLSAVAGGAVVRQYMPGERVITKDKIVTIIKRVTRPDGSTEENIRKEEDRLVDEKRSLQPQWQVSAGLATNNVYTLSVQRRILGPIFIGGTAQTNNSFGLSLGVEF